MNSIASLFLSSDKCFLHLSRRLTRNSGGFRIVFHGGCWFATSGSLGLAFRVAESSPSSAILLQLPRNGLSPSLLLVLPLLLAASYVLLLSLGSTCLSAVCRAGVSASNLSSFSLRQLAFCFATTLSGGRSAQASSVSWAVGWRHPVTTLAHLFCWLSMKSLVDGWAMFSQVLAAYSATALVVVMYAVRRLSWDVPVFLFAIAWSALLRVFIFLATSFACSMKVSCGSSLTPRNVGFLVYSITFPLSISVTCFFPLFSAGSSVIMV